MSPDENLTPAPPASLGQEIVGAEQRDVMATRTDAERLRLIDRELRTGFESLAGIGPAVCVFGSARTAAPTTPSTPAPGRSPAPSVRPGSR